jgi:hypothetical protein
MHAVVDVRWNSRVARDQFRIIGEDGEINRDPLNSQELRVTTPEESLVGNSPPQANLHYPVVKKLVDAVLTNDPGRVACSTEQGAWVGWTIAQVVR